LFAWLAFIPFVLRFADYFFGVSKMPFAIKTTASG